MKINNLEEIANEIINFDHTYEYSDDHSVWSAGNKKEKEIIAITKQLTEEEKNILLESCKQWFNEVYKDHPKFEEWDIVLGGENYLHGPVVFKMVKLCQANV